MMTKDTNCCLAAAPPPSPAQNLTTTMLHRRCSGQHDAPSLWVGAGPAGGDMAGAL